jgi:hypothetical protein
MIDSIETIRTMIDRYKTYSLIQTCDFETKGELALGFMSFLQLLLHAFI